MRKNLIVTIQAILMCWVIATAWGSLTGCSNEFIELNDAGDDAGDGDPDGADGEVVCVPDDTDAIISPRVITGEDPDCNLLAQCPGSLEADMLCRGPCLLVCPTLVAAGLYWHEGQCTTDCQEARGCPRAPTPWDYVRTACPNDDRLVTEREEETCRRDAAALTPWCSTPEECWITDDWLPESCTWTSLCDPERDSC